MSDYQLSRVIKTKPYQNNRGVALITVLLIVALAAVLATEMTARLQLQMQRTNNITLNQQAYWYAMGAEAFAKTILINGDANVQSEGRLTFVLVPGYYLRVQYLIF